MSGRRAIPMFIALAILLLNGGDCISPLFADQQSKDCCTRGKCNPLQKADPCCQTTSPSATQDFQASAKVTLDHGSVLLMDAFINVVHFEPSLVTFPRDYLDMASKSPPGTVKGVSLPLLI